jgi:HPt (histidine-containing phosphotransfer) domain-containing protein
VTAAQNAPRRAAAPPPPANSPAAALLDAGVLRDIAALGRPALLSTLIDLYMQHSPSLIGAIEAAAHNRQQIELVEAIHTLKSSTANLGGARLTALLKECEAMANGGRVEEAAQRLLRLRAEYRDFCDALEREKAASAA